MPDTVLKQIQYLCQAIPKVEWSGMLFYSIEGTIKDPKNMVITLEDILPMDKGTTTATAYEIDERYMDYVMEEGKEERQSWKFGHIHSHNTMPVFFSGTDNEELEDNAPSHNFYLSLIVNNFMDFMAKVAFMGAAKGEFPANFISKDENGEDYEISESMWTVDSKKMYLYNCDIITSIVKTEVDDDFTEKVAELLKPVYTQPANVIGFQQTGGPSTTGSKVGQQQHIPYSQQGKGKKGTPKGEKEVKTEESDLFDEELYFMGHSDVAPFGEIYATKEEMETMYDEDEPPQDDVNSLIMDIIHPNYPVAFDYSDLGLTLCIEDYWKSVDKIDSVELATDMLDRFPLTYKAYFPGFDSSEDLNDVVEAVIKTLNRIITAGDYHFLRSPLEHFKKMFSTLEDELAIEQASV